MKLFNTADFNHIRAGASYIRTHRIKKVCKINYMRLLGRIFNNGKPSCKHCRKHNIYCCANRNNVHINRCAHKLFRLCANHAVYYIYISTEHFKSLYVLINRSVAEIAAAGECNICFSKSAKHCADKIIACSEMRCKLIRHRIALKHTRVYFNSIFINNLNMCTHLIKNFDNERNI